MAAYIFDHILIVVLATSLSVVLGVALAMVAYTIKFTAKPILILSDIIQTIPSLALLAVLMIIFGLGNVTLIVGLVLYSLFPIVRNTYTGLTQVPAYLKDAARGMGMSRLQRMAKVELPLALPLIIAGIKIALVTALSTAVIGVLIGGDGLGYPIYRGIQTQDFALIAKGALPIVIAAVVFDVAISKLEKVLAKHTNIKKLNSEV